MKLTFRTKLKGHYVVTELIGRL